MALDLMGEGYEVFAALSPSASCDLIALKNGVSSRVQVRTGRRYEPNGRVYVKDSGEHDILAVVVGEEIMYEPELWYERA